MEHGKHEFRFSTEIVVAVLRRDPTSDTFLCVFRDFLNLRRWEKRGDVFLSCNVAVEYDEIPPTKEHIRFVCLSSCAFACLLARSAFLLCVCLSSCTFAFFLAR